MDRQTLCDENVRIMDRLRNFDAVRTSVVIFGSGKRFVRQIDLLQMDVVFRRRRKFMRIVAVPPSGMDWARPWQEVFHIWNGRVV